MTRIGKASGISKIELGDYGGEEEELTTLRLLPWPVVEEMKPLLKSGGDTCLENMSPLNRSVVIWRQEKEIQ